MAQDSSGDKYRILEEMGESIDMTLGRLNVETGHVDWYRRPHHVTDGVGAVQDLLKRHGNKIDQVPLMKPGKVPGRLKRLFLLWEHIKNMPSRHYAWKTWHEKQFGRGLCLAYAQYDRDGTRALLDYARSQKSSLNSVLLWTLNECACELLLTEPPEESVWTIPLNLRGGVKTDNAAGNVTASISLRLPPDPELRYIDDKIKSIYQQGVHWGAWVMSNMTRYVGKKLFRHLAKNSKPIWMGVFSNVGSWPLEELPHAIDDRYAYLGLPPATYILPVTCCSLTWNGRMSLTAQLHSSISDDSADTQKLIAAWTDKLNQLAGISTDQVRVKVEPWPAVREVAEEY